jgi:hypothetical protein
MATGNLSAELRIAVGSMRFRGTELSERKVDCILPGCEVKSKTFRVIAKHFRNTHSTESVLGFRCKFPSCSWYCMKSLKCFTEHMKIHNVTVDENTEMSLVIVRKTRHTDHTAICNTMKAETIADNLAKKEEERVARKIAKNAKKTNKDIPTNNNDQQNPEITNEVEISDDPLDEGVESIITQIRNAENVNTQQEENIPTISTTELDISLSGNDYNPEDITNYEDDESEDEEEAIEENTGDNLQSYSHIKTMRKAFKKEFEEVDLTNSDDEDEVVESIPVENVKSTKRKLCFTVSDNIVKKSKRF